MPARCEVRTPCCRPCRCPGGVPVATVAIGKAGAKNAGYLAVQILGAADDALASELSAERERNAAEILRRNDALQEKLLDR